MLKSSSGSADAEATDSGEPFPLSAFKKVLIEVLSEACFTVSGGTAVDFFV